MRMETISLKNNCAVTFFTFPSKVVFSPRFARQTCTKNNLCALHDVIGASMMRQPRLEKRILSWTVKSHDENALKPKPQQTNILRRLTCVMASSLNIELAKNIKLIMRMEARPLNNNCSVTFVTVRGYVFVHD